MGFWPAIVWHGYGGPTGTAWRWDIHSTIAELVYFGVIAFTGGLVALGKRIPAGSPPRGRMQVEATVPPAAPATPPVKAASPGPLPQPAPAPPFCMHLGAVKVPDLHGNVLHCWCPECEAELPSNWRLLCCGTEPETPHAYNCPHREPQS